MSSPSTICCMCGDHGLPQELFQCKSCHFRSQHKYCSDLYPKAEAYGTCNWCLREQGGKSSNADTNNSIASSSSSSNNGATGVKLLDRGPFSSQLNKPVKKQRVPERSSSDVTAPMRSEELSPGSGRSRQAFRGKARRYKLLEEVSS